MVVYPDNWPTGRLSRLHSAVPVSVHGVDCKTCKTQVDGGCPAGPIPHMYPFDFSSLVQPVRGSGP